jgi:hypothetical protein
MACYEDLSGCPGFGAEHAGKLLAVGWLSPRRDYTRGEVEADFVNRLVDLLVDPWQPAVSPGRHACEFCRLTGGPSMIEYQGKKVLHIGQTNLFVPAEGFLYVAPSSILHYIDAHEYAPPPQFCRAVLDCPPMRSVQYLRAILTNGPRW